jgi:hypothetical protein
LKFIHFRLKFSSLPKTPAKLPPDKHQKKGRQEAGGEGEEEEEDISNE